MAKEQAQLNPPTGEKKSLYYGSNSCTFHDAQGNQIMKQLRFTFIAIALVMAFTFCGCKEKKEAVTETAAQTEAQQAESETPDEIIVQADTFAAENTAETQDQINNWDEFPFPSQVSFFQYFERPSQYSLSIPRARIWGWSKNGKVAYSIDNGVDARGGQKIDFVILDLITDHTVFELEMDSYYHDYISGEALYDLFKATILNALSTNNIIGQKTDFLRFPIRKNNTVYDCNFINVEYGKDPYDGALFDKVVKKYTVLLTAGEKSKVIANFTPIDTLTTGNIYVCGYVLSPYEDRALVIVAEEHRGFEGNDLVYRLSGCHLGVGFN